MKYGVPFLCSCFSLRLIPAAPSFDLQQPGLAHDEDGSAANPFRTHQAFTTMRSESKGELGV